jgi:hypothetical protein
MNKTGRRQGDIIVGMSKVVLREAAFRNFHVVQSFACAAAEQKLIVGSNVHVFTSLSIRTAELTILLGAFITRYGIELARLPKFLPFILSISLTACLRQNILCPHV